MSPVMCASTPSGSGGRWLRSSGTRPTCGHPRASLTTLPPVASSMLSRPRRWPPWLHRSPCNRQRHRLDHFVLGDRLRRGRGDDPQRLLGELGALFDGFVGRELALLLRRRPRPTTAHLHHQLAVGLPLEGQACHRFTIPPPSRRLTLGPPASRASQIFGGGKQTGRDRLSSRWDRRDGWRTRPTGRVGAAAPGTRGSSGSAENTSSAEASASHQAPSASSSSS